MHLFHATIARVRALGEYIRSHRATSGLFVLSLVVGMFWAGTAAHAQVIGDQSGIFNQMMSLITHIMLALARICISLTLFGLKFFIELAKYNGFIDAPPVIIGWVMIRDIANMCFIVVLLVIAFGTILGLDQYEWKKALAKLVVAAILLNFSKLIAQLMIDVAHVVTMTFLNAISATAGGNLINLFHLQGMMSLLASDPSTLDSSDIRLDIFMASVLALVFAAMAMMTIGAYVVVMVFRVVVLWILMILAPLAYIMSVVPQTQGYASEYWSKFTKHVIVAPVMVFFLWLSFATLGSGNIGTQIGLDLKGEGNVIQSASGIQQSAASNPSTSLLEVSTWENMGSFIIAIAFLVIGIGMVQQLGVEGGGLVGGVTDFGKKVFTIASGYAAGRFLAGAAGKGLGFAVKEFPVIGTEKWKQRFKVQGQNIRAWYLGKGAGLELDYTDKDLQRKKLIQAGLQKSTTELSAKGNRTEEENQLLKKNTSELEKVGKEVESLEARKQQMLKSGVKGGLGTVGNVFGAVARSGIALERRAAKAEKLAEQRHEILWKRTESETGGYGLLGVISDKDKNKFYNRIALSLGLAEVGIMDQDRFEKGILEVEEMRSDGKTAEMSAEGKRNALNSPRIKDAMFQTDKPTMAEQIAAHAIMRDMYENNAHKYQAEAKLKILQLPSLPESQRKQSVPWGTFVDTAKYGGIENIRQYIESQIESHEQEELAKLEEEGLKTDAEKAHLKHADHDLEEAARLKREASQLESEDGKRLRKAAADAMAPHRDLEKTLQDHTVEANAALQEFGKIDQDFKAVEGEIAQLEKAIEDQSREVEKISIEALGETDEKKKKDLLQKVDAMRQNLDTMKKRREQSEGVYTKLKQDWQTSQKKSGDAAKKLEDFKKDNATQIEAMSKAEKVAKENLREAHEADANDKNLQNQKEEMHKQAEDAIQHSLVGRLAYKTGVVKDREGFVQALHTKLFDDASQIAVWDRRGIVTPSTALTPIIEKYEKEFRDMTYEMTTRSMSNALNILRQKRKNNVEIEDDEKMSLMALFKHAFNNGWVDDGIIALMEDPSLKEFAQKSLGWKDQEFTIEKINQIQALFATGMDEKFAEIHTKIANGIDVAINEMEMTLEGFYNGVGSKKFIDKNGRDRTAEFAQKYQDLFEKIKDVSAGDVEYYKKVMRESQSQLQLIGNLRDAAIAGNHSENGGHAQLMDVGGGEQMFVMVNGNMARNYVYSDLNKTNVQTRAKQHTHTLANLDEETGVVTELREKDFGMIRKGISNSQLVSNSNGRLINQLAGMTATADFTEYLDPRDGALVIAGNDRKGRKAKIAEVMEKKNAELYKDVKSEEERNWVTSSLIMRKLFAGQIRQNKADFLMRMADVSQVDKNEALSDGTMNIKMWVKGKNGNIEQRHITNIDDLVSLYNQGAFAETGDERFDRDIVLQQEKKPSKGKGGGKKKQPQEDFDDNG